MEVQRSNKRNSIWSALQKSVRWLGEVLNHDFSPGANRYVYWLKQPVGWIVSATLFSALVGCLVGPQGFVLMWSFIAFLIVGAIWPLVGMKGVNCRLHFDVANTQEQQATTARLVVTNRWPIPVFGLTVEGQFLQDIFEDDDRVAVGLQRIPGWSESEFKWEFKPARRGVMPNDLPEIGTGFPFGIYNSKRPVDVGQQVIVWPKCESLVALRGLDGSNFNIEGTLSDRPGHDGDVIGARPFRRGDLLRHVNWAKTARSGDLIVLERQTAAQKSIRILVDLRPQQHSGLGSQSTYEWAIRIAASIGKHLHLHQSHIRLQCVGTGNDGPCISTNQRGLKPMMDFLAMLPTFEDVQSKCQLQTFETLPIQVRPDEEVYLIGAGQSARSELLKTSAARVQEILLSPPTDSLAQAATVATLAATENRLVIDNWQMLEQQFQTGWERLCSDG